MFERYLAEALAVHFGHFLEDFDADKVKVSVWNGEVVLKDLKLKSDALQRLLDKKSGGSTNDSGKLNGGNYNNNNDRRNSDSEDGNEQEDEDEDEDGASGFPFQISYGHIGTFELHIPWKLLRSSQASYFDGSWSMWGGRTTPKTNTNDDTLGGDTKAENVSTVAQMKEGVCSVTLSDVNILVNPGKVPQKKKTQNDAKPNDDSRARSHEDRIRKEREVQKLLDEALLRNNIDIAAQTQTDEQKGDNAKSQFVRNLIKNIVSSLSITVKNVHIRYEDPGDCLGFVTKIRSGEKRRIRYRPPFAIGITLKEFSVCSTENGPLSDDELYCVPDIVNLHATQNLSNSDNDQQKPFNDSESNGSSFATQHKLAAAKSVSVYWDSDLPVNEIIHISVNRTRRRRQRRESSVHSIYDNEVDHTEQKKVAESSIPSNMVTHDNSSSFIKCVDAQVNEAQYSSHEEERNENDMYKKMLNGAMDIPSTSHLPVHRTYIIEPISPSLHFTIVTLLSEESGKLHSDKNEVPPSRAVLNLPPFQTNISKNAMEDIAYLRRSYTLWKDMKNDILSRKVYMKLMKVRPSTSPLENPRSWWRYAFEAVKTLSKFKTGRQTSLYGQGKKGWLRLSQCLRLRREYWSLYEELLDPNAGVETKARLSNELTRVEDILTIEEIAAFRVGLVSSKSPITGNDRVESCDPSLPMIANRSSTWTRWIPLWSHTQSESSCNDPTPNSSLKETYTFFSDSEMLSFQHRESMYYELTQVLGSEAYQIHDAIFNFSNKVSNANLMKNVTSGSKLDISIICPQVTLQAEDIIAEKRVGLCSSRSSYHRQPIVQLTFASVQKFCLRHDSSWDILCTLASLEVLDLMNQSKNKSSNCPRLLTRKRQWTSSLLDNPAKSVRFGDISHFHSATVFVQKNLTRESQTYDDDDETEISTTFVNINISPMEATHTPEPLSLLTRLFSNAKTTELLSDYQRLKSFFSSWQAQQKRRLVEVLSQREKKLIVKVDVAAPVFFMHDEMSNGTLMVDLGMLTFYNSEKGDETQTFDDGWRLLLKDIQVLSLPRSESISKPKFRLVEHEKTCHIIEPFSLDFMVYTKFGESEWTTDNNCVRLSSEILIKATLPRLVFNLASSSVRLIHRLTSHREITKSRSSLLQDKSDDTQDTANNRASNNIHPEHDNGRNKSLLKFDFSAPLIALRLTNDVDGRDCMPQSSKSSGNVTQIAELVIQGIGGQLSHSNGPSSAEKETAFCASLKTLHAKDSYQQVGHEYSLLLSSQRPESHHHDGAPLSSTWSSCTTAQTLTSCFIDPAIEYNDLVRIDYEKQVSSNMNKTDLKIHFHELFVEWNPETLAAIQKAMRLSLLEKQFLHDLSLEKNDINIFSPRGILNQNESSDDDTAFFDTIEDLDLDDNDEGSDSDEGSDDFFLSDVSTNLDNDESQLKLPPSVSMSPTITPMVLKAVEAMSLGQESSDKYIVHDSDGTDKKIQNESGDAKNRPRPVTSLSFHLSKLRMRLNKESRFRRLVTAEMSETLVQYESKALGGSSTNMKVGNLTLTDPVRSTGSTLYGEILGLKSDVSGNASLLEINFETFPRNDLDNNHHPREQHPRIPVQLDAISRTVYGCDNYISLNFSPMRFVYLQQLWLEIIDYFFEGILGYDVWGKIRPDNVNIGTDRDKEIVEEILSRNRDRKSEVDPLPGAASNEMRFTLFEIVMESPTIIMPVAYRSPQHLSFDFNSVKISNRYTAQVHNCTETAGSSYVQWYNNCDARLCGMALSSWCGMKLSINEDPKKIPPENMKGGGILLNISIKWPSGPYAPLVVPKWNIKFKMNTVRLLLRKNDYALIRHVIWNNIGEESRHLDEWNSLQTLPPHELTEYKKRIMVHFGYDKKDGPPTTYRFVIDVKSFVIHFDHVADIDCFALKWSLEKKRDRISRQKLSCDSIYLEQTTGNEEWTSYKKLFFPLEDSELKAVQKNDHQRAFKRKPQLLYSSTSRISGDNVKYLEVNDACIIFIYPAWIFVKNFFQNLPPPDIMKRDEVVNSLQIGDRWYRINRTEEGEDISPYTMLNERQSSEEKQGSSNEDNAMPEYQFRVVLVSPRIILVDSSSFEESQSIVTKGRAVTLRLGHLDFFRKIDTNESNSKAIFVHDLELFTGLADDAIRRGNQHDENSLIYPLCIGAGSSTHVDDGTRDLPECSKWLVADVISARAAYTDMILALEVFQKTLSDYHKVNETLSVEETTADEDIEDKSTDGSKLQESVNLACGGFDLLVVDDSGRQFASAQELVQVSLSGILYNRWHGLMNASHGMSVQNDADIESITRLQLKGLEVVDFLQPVNSPFRIVAAAKGATFASKSESSRWDSMNKTLFQDFMDWERYSLVSSAWGFSLAPSLIDRMNIATKPGLQARKTANFVEINRSTYVGLRDDVSFKIREIVLQWNPSMAIALQRFLGRVKKQANKFGAPVQMSDASSRKTETNAKVKRFLRAEIEIDALTLCLNKEHQQRRLLQVTLSKTVIVFERDYLSRLNLHGYIGDINAWDCDGNREGQIAIRDSNRLVLCVLRNPVLDDDSKSCSSNDSYNYKQTSKEERFISFQYYCRPSQLKNDDQLRANDNSLPHWVTKLVGTEISVESIDDCLSLTVATVRFNYLSDRTGEIIDYLSNGLPGKGMGATSRAAKGFINKRIRTRSFLILSLNAPQLFLPRHRGDEQGIIISLGDVRLRSWFEEATVEECEAIQCKHLTVQNHFPPSKNKKSSDSDGDETFWWRVLSVSFLELGWRIHAPGRDSLSIENPVDLHLHLRKPPTQNNLSLIVRCKLSFMDLVLSYVDYVLLRSVLKDNIMKKIDKSLWDNIEEEYPMEDSEVPSGTSDVINHGVKYATGARFVRYGPLSRRTALPDEEKDKDFHDKGEPRRNNSFSDTEWKNKTALDLRFSLEGLSLILHRDDPIETNAANKAIPQSNFCYDIASLEVDQIDISLSASSKGAKSATLKFYQLALVDLGDFGRLVREGYFHVDHRKRSLHKKKKPSAFTVIAEGYDAFDGKEGNAVIDDNGEIVREPQVTITLDTRLSADVDFGGLVDQCDNTTVTVACVRMNFMNLNPLVRPLKDIADFISCKWSREKERETKNDLECVERRPDQGKSEETNSSIEKDQMRSVQGFQLKVVAHYPRVFLLADECDPSTRALVLRGLAIITASIIEDKVTGGSKSDGKTHTSIEGQFHSLESYINPQPRRVLENDSSTAPNEKDTLGVALIEPVTALFHFHQVKRVNFPLIREVYLNMESVSTTLSFEDIRLIETVLSRWKSASKNAIDTEEDIKHMTSKTENEDGLFRFPNTFDHDSCEGNENPISSKDLVYSSITQSSTTEMQQTSGVYCSDYIPCHDNCGGKHASERKSEFIAVGDEYNVLFKSKTLGLVLRKSGTAVIVDKILEAESTFSVVVGDEVISIEGKSVKKMPLQSIVSSLANKPRPLSITFRRVGPSSNEPPNDTAKPNGAMEEHDWDDNFGEFSNSPSRPSFSRSNSSNLTTPVGSTNDDITDNLSMNSTNKRYPVNITIQSGLPHGLRIERSPCGDAVLVSSVNRGIFERCVKGEQTDFPSPGAVILAIKNIPVYKIGFDRTKEILENISTSRDRELCDLTFVEVASEDWGSVDKIDIVVSGIKLTLIDDIAGRDMPLLRGSLQSIAVRIERGLGIECNSIEVGPPSILVFDPIHGRNTPVVNDQSEVIFKMYANAETRLDYYNARIASWEPLLEPSHLNGEMEYQKGQIGRPGALSMALSDYQAIEGSEDLQQSLVCINITDAAANVLISAFYEWKQWRKRSSYGDDTQNNHPDSRYMSNIDHQGIHLMSKNRKGRLDYSLDTAHLVPSNKVDTKKGAVQNAAQAALIFAQRRGAEGSDGAKPFVLRNKTGMNISFVPQTQRNLLTIDDDRRSDPQTATYGLFDFITSSITAIKDGDEACFSMDAIENDSLASGTGVALIRSGNRIRTYDGQFPLLSVCLHASNNNTRVEILQDLSVVKIGKELRRLRVSINSNAKSDSGYIHVVWSVDLEHNRRIITISSAVSLTSPKCSIPVEIGIKIYDDNSNNGDNFGTVKSIGFSSSLSDCYLPLWVDLCFKRVDVFVRPKSKLNRYQWSAKSILEFKNIDYERCGSTAPETWQWVLSNDGGSAYCAPDEKQSGVILPAWLSYDCIQGSSELLGKSKKSALSFDDNDNEYQMICLNVFCSLSIRNILPEAVEWEVSSGETNDLTLLDGSSLRRYQKELLEYSLTEDEEREDFMIVSGGRKEVISCDMSTMMVNIRFRCKSEEVWTDWTLINDKFPAQQNENESQLYDEVDGLYKTRHVNLKLQNGFGVPLMLGMKIIPKDVHFKDNGCRYSKRIVGFDMILHSELWVCNLTSLPITFGAPFFQMNDTNIHSSVQNDGVKDRNSMLNAETALLELASILEFGDKGHSFANDNDDPSNSQEITVLPKQQSGEIIEEIFEYTEIENGSVKRQWWASEKHNNERPSPRLLDSMKDIEWSDQNWHIDTSGNCKATDGGWESCSNLVGGKTKYFSKERNFDKHHRFRRRRWFRKRITSKRESNERAYQAYTQEDLKLQQQIGADLNCVAFYQPLIDSESRERKKVKSNQKNATKAGTHDASSKSFLDVATEIVNEDCLKLHFKIRDGSWSKAALIPLSGAGHGIVEIHSSRWPVITKKLSPRKRRQKAAEIVSNNLAAGTQGPSRVSFSGGCLSPSCYELSYQVSVMEGQWGEYSRVFLLYPRYILRNDSELWHFDVKQVGAPDNTSIRVHWRASVPFYWADISLPKLICVRPIDVSAKGKSSQCYRWSGGFDICDLGMIPIRVRLETKNSQQKAHLEDARSEMRDRPFIRVIRSLIEIRSGTGGTGITVSFREESVNGEDSLYRIENHSPFPLWIAQDGVLANPHYEKGLFNSEDTEFSSQSESHGDLLAPDEKIAFGLDVPFRQGKYAGRRVAAPEELLTIRVALAPLSTRDGIETMKVIGLSFVGCSVRLKPSNLRSFLGEDLLSEMMNVRVQGVICADGPTRVLKFNLVQRDLSATGVIRNSVRLHASIAQTSKQKLESLLKRELTEAANEVSSLLRQGKIPKNTDMSLFIDTDKPQSEEELVRETDGLINCFYAITACFSGFVISFIDSVPSEIAVVSIKKLDFMAKWDLNRKKDATAAVSIGWLQIDNQCPNAPFPVALSPAMTEEEISDGNTQNQNPFICIGVVFAPRHKSNIMCFKGLTIHPRDVALCTDLAFIMRLQHFLLNLQLHFERSREKDRLHVLDHGQSNTWMFPDLKKMFKKKIGSTTTGLASSKLYFEVLTVLPFNIKLSVASAVALTGAQTALEGPEAGAIHTAVRKGDVLIGDDVTGVLGVKIGGKNRTASAVIRGVFKSILVDSLLRCDGASMNFSGVGLRNHIATTSQLKTYIGHHYLSLLKSNVPALLGSLAAFGNPVGLIRGFGDGVTDFVNEPIKGLKKSVTELDPTHAVTGVARGTGSLARHTVGGIVDSASLLTETFSKNMAVLTLDRKYAQRRDRFKTLPGTSTTFVKGVESGVEKLLRGVAEGVVGVVRAPMRGAEKRGVEGFAKGIGKGLLGLVVKPVIGLSDAATDVMVGVKGALDGDTQRGANKVTQIRPRRAFYGHDRVLRPYQIVDAISAAIMMRTRLAGENYLTHVDMGGRVAILGVKRFLLLGDDGETQLLIRFRNIKFIELRQVPKPDESGMEWGILIFLKNRKHGDIEVITTDNREIGIDLCTKIKQGISLSAAKR